MESIRRQAILPRLATCTLLIGKSGANLRRIVDVNHIQRKALVSTSAFTLSAYLDIQHTNIVITRRATECAGLWIETQPARQRFAICQASAVGQFVVLVGGVECILRKGISQLFLFMNALRRQRFASGWRLRLFRLRFGIRLCFWIRIGFVVIIQRRQFQSKGFPGIEEAVKNNPALKILKSISDHKAATHAGQFGCAVIGAPFVISGSLNLISGQCFSPISNTAFAVSITDGRKARYHRTVKGNVISIIATTLIINTVET